MTVWGTFQLAGVNVREDVLTVPSAVFDELIGMVTSAVGWLLRAIVNDTVPPDSVVADDPPMMAVATPAVSLSVLVQTTSVGSRPLKFGSELTATPRMIE